MVSIDKGLWLYDKLSPGKANVVADELSRKERVNVMSLPKELIKEMKKRSLD